MKKGYSFFRNFQSIISLYALKLALNRNMRAYDDEQVINKWRPKSINHDLDNQKFLVGPLIMLQKLCCYLPLLKFQASLKDIAGQHNTF